jgi:hypothetical protein
MFSLSVKQAKKGFFDRKRIIDAVDRAEREALSKFGAFVRQRARSSIRKRKAISKPGSPPSGHAGQLRDLIYFSYDAGRRSVVIGPTRFRRGEAPKLLEYGGEVSRDAKRLRYRPRPFMGPAYAAELPRVSDLWKNSVK